MGGGALLVHGFARGDIVASLDALLGERAARIVHARAANGIVVLASDLDHSDPEAAFGDSETVKSLAVDHAKVLAGLAACSDVVPLRLGTVVSGQQALTALCGHQAEAMSGILDAIAGRLELGVSVRQHPDTGDAPVAPPAATGRSYLRARASERGAKLQSTERQHAFCVSLAEHLATVSDVRNLAPRDGRAVDGRLADFACLVERGRADDFVADLMRRTSDAASFGLDVAVTGPWPAYSFVAPSAFGQAQ